MERTYYDLSPSQNILMYAQKFTLHKQVNNICTLALTDTPLDFDILRKAVEKAYERNESLRIRLVKEGKAVKQYFASQEAPLIEFLDFRNRSSDEMEKVLYKIASKRITFFEKPLSKVYLLHSFDGRNGLYFAVSHIVMDSWAIAAFFKDVLAIYESFSLGKDMPKPLASYEELLKKELNYKNTEAYKKDREFWEKCFESEEPLFSHINGPVVLEKYRSKKKNPNLRYAPYFSLRTKANNVALPVPGELVGLMENFCAVNKVTMQSMVLLAFRCYLSKINNNQKDISVNTVVARRGTLEEKNSGGCRIRFFLLRTVFEENDTLKKACQITSEKLASIYRHADIDSLEVMDIWRKKYNTPRLGEYATSAFTFQPVKLTSPNGMKIESKWYGNGATQQLLYPTVMDGDGTGALKIYYEYRLHDVALESVKKLHSYMIKFFEEGMKKDDITIGELLSIE